MTGASWIIIILRVVVNRKNGTCGNLPIVKKYFTACFIQTDELISIEASTETCQLRLRVVRVGTFMDRAAV